MSREPKNFEQTCRMPEFSESAEPDVTMNDFFFRRASLIVLVILIGVLLAQIGCTMPKTVNFAPLVDLNVKDSANGNTVPVSAVP